jgi:putative oxidoreductase
MQSLISALSGLSGIAFLLLRLMMASILVVAGYSKFFVSGIDKVATMFQGYGIIPWPQGAAPFIGALELGGGILLALGLFTRYLGVLYFVEFLVAWWVKFNVMAPPAGGYLVARLDSMLIVTALVLATHGAGMYSIDAWRNRA